MNLAIFDLDNTLLGGDSDYLWGQFLIEQGVVDGDYYERENQRYFDDYKQGSLDIMAFLRFALEPLKNHSQADLDKWHAEFLEEKIRPIMLPKAESLIDHHRSQGDLPIIITATNRFVTGPIANLLGIDHLLATEPEMINGRYTGEISGVPCFQAGKVTRLEEWLKTEGHTLKGSWFYSDSHNDLPLLKMVDNPVAVDPDEKLEAYAREHDWPVVSLLEPHDDNPTIHR